MSRPIPDTHESRLKKVLGVVTKNGEVDEAQELPADVQALYWQCEKVSRKIGRGGVSDDVLIFIAVLSGAYSEDAKPEPDPIEQGTPVQVKWRGEWIDAEFVGEKNGKQVVRIPNDVEQSREFAAYHVRKPEPVA